MPDQAPENRLLTLSEVAVYLAISTKAVSKHVHAGDLPFVPIGTGKVRPRMRFEQKDVEDFVNRRKQRLSPALPNAKARQIVRRDQPSGFLERRAQMLEQRKAMRERDC